MPPRHESDEYPPVSPGRSSSDDRWLRRTLDELSESLRTFARDISAINVALATLATRREGDAADLVQLSTGVSKVRHDIVKASKDLSDSISLARAALEHEDRSLGGRIDGLRKELADLITTAVSALRGALETEDKSLDARVQVLSAEIVKLKAARRSARRSGIAVGGGVVAIAEAVRALIEALT